MPRHKRDPRDVEIAKRVRTLRLQRGMSQTELGGVLDVTFQQVQKYETGSNRISAGRLQQIAEVLGVPVTYFYSGFEDAEKSPTQPVESELDFLQSPQAVRLSAHPGSYDAAEIAETHRVHCRRVTSAAETRAIRRSGSTARTKPCWSRRPAAEGLPPR